MAAEARWLVHRNQAFWFEYLQDSGTVFVQINQATTDPDNPWNPQHDRYREFLDQVFGLVDANPVQRLVIDLRHNGGGDEDMWQPLVHHIVRAQKINQPGRIFVLIGRLTESASVAWAAKLEGETMALFAGEPTASPPNYYNDHDGPKREVFHFAGLPINYRISRQLDIWSVSDDLRTAILPDFATPMRYEDFANGVDRALEVVLRVDPAHAKAYFTTEEGEDVTDKPLSHYLRKSQAAAVP